MVWILECAMQEVTRFFSKTILRTFATTFALERPQLNGRLISVVSGFGKNRNVRSRPGRFGDDSYFMATSKTGDVIGEFENSLFVEKREGFFKKNYYPQVSLTVWEAGGNTELIRAIFRIFS